ncbi:succinylglutamate desuccinylase/aspartoacylase family protein [Bacilliculturomica massiliensis]|uniref:succinylglutamate desuccinylase/aspartoacylase family protein n=1 Tax=Bacilliculturomica massiliensis TaxID=1917867 RepID=UPI00102F50DA|nr:succinylglutamate desuccinylase/aspartoacylase family protein [Bacilliculturomica massiliensis]
MEMNMLENFNLKEELKKRGTKKIGYVPFAQKANGSWVSIPVMLAVGKKEGPVLLADGCCHGDEYEGTEGIIAAFDALDVSEMSGAFVGVPALNLDAFGEMRRYNGNDFVPVDLNRTFPGNEEGYFTSSLAHFYFNNFIKHANGLITLHGGGNYLYLSPVTNFQHMGDETSKMSEAMARAFGFEVLWRDDECSGEQGMEDQVSYLNGVPAITPEIGGQATRLHHREETVGRIREGIMNVLRLFKILDGEVKTFDDQYYVNLEYIYSRHGGIHKPLKKEGEEVRKGETLSIITDVFGREVDRVLSPYDGVVVGFLAYSIINPRSWSYLLGRDVKKAD